MPIANTESPKFEAVNSTDYKLVRLTVSSERIQNPTNSVELKLVGIEINIFEHIEKPYLTGSMIFLDNFDLLGLVGFVGSERITIELMTDELIPSLTIKKQFIVTEIENIVKSNTHNQVMSVKFIEDIGYVSRLKKVSKAYDGTPDQIIRKILAEHLRRELKDVSSTIHSDGYMRVIVPNMTPLQACAWVKDRGVTTNGMPYYLFSTMADDKIRYLDLEKVIQSPALNNDTLDYTYSPAHASGLAMQDKHTQSYSIGAVYPSRNSGQLKFAQRGLLASTYNFVDTLTGQVYEEKLNANEMYKDLKEKNLLSNNHLQREFLIDNTTIVDDKLPHEFDTKLISQVTTSNIYSDDIYSYQESANEKSHILKAKQKSIKGLLDKSSIEIAVTGRNFLYKDVNVTVGNNINISFFNSKDQSDGDENPNDTKYKDYTKSGTYMIYACRHIFSGVEYNASLSCVKLAEGRAPNG